MDYKGDLYYISQVLGGNISAFTSLVNRHKDHAYNLALRICGNNEDAEEVAQDSFLKAYRSLARFRMKSSFSTWLYRIIYNTAISYIRAKNYTTLNLDDFPAVPSDFATDGSTEETEMTEYRKSLVNFALKNIKEDERALITLFYYEDLRMEEIAEITGLSMSNIKTKLFRARKKMCGIIEKAETKNLVYYEQRQV